MSTNVVLIGEFDDVDLLTLERILVADDVRVSRFPLGCDAAAYDISWALGATPRLVWQDVVLTDGILAEASAVLFKLARMDERSLVSVSEMTPAENAFARREWDTSVRSALTSLLSHRRGRIIGHPRDLIWHDWKPVLLDSAQSLGLNVPRTLITTHTSQVVQSGFVPVLAKAINANEVIDQSLVVGTTLLSRDVLGDLAASTVVVPSLVQEGIRRTRELRSILLADNFLDVEVAVSEDIVDIREVEQPQVLSLTTSARSTHFLAPLADAYGLSYCCFDTLIDMNGVRWLIDVTPRGSWHWYDSPGAPQVSTLIARLLASREGAGE